MKKIQVGSLKSFLTNINDRVKVRFIFRLPETFMLVAAVKNNAFAANKWEVVGPGAKTTKKSASYQIASFVQELNGIKYRLVVLLALDKPKETKWNRTVDQERTMLTVAIKELQRKNFSCRPYAKQALALHAFFQTYAGSLHRVPGMVIKYTETKYPPGCPYNDVEHPRETYY